MMKSLNRIRNHFYQASNNKIRQQQLQNNPGVAGMFQERRQQAIQRSQIEAQMHAQAQAQAEARVKALLDQEAQVQEQLRQLRQRQMASPSNTSMNMNTFDMMSSGANRSMERLAAGADSLQLESPIPSLSRTTRTAAMFSSPGGLRSGMLLGNPATTGGSNPMAMASSNTNRLNMNLAAANMNMNSVLPDNSLRDEEAMVFGKISSQQGAAADALEIQSRQAGAGLSDSVSIHSRNAKSSKDGAGDELKQGDEDASNTKQEADVMLEEDEDDKLDDDEYFKPNLGEPNADGAYPIPRAAFPIKLYRILHEAKANGQDDIISFFPHGRAFAVHKSKEFTRDIMPKYFPAGRMNTFLKQLNLYGFRRITE